MRAIRMILLHGESSTTLPKMAAGGKAYASISSYGRLSASTAEVMHSPGAIITEIMVC